MMFRSIVLLCALALPMTNAVINEPKVERREAFQTYGPPPVQQPQQQTIVLPTPVYGAPAVSNYPPPPPERPPPPPKEYGVPMLQYGPPKVQIEYGPPPPAHSVQQIQTGNHHHHQVINHGQNSLSFFEQIKQSLGFGSSASQGYAPHQSHQPHTSYGPPPQATINHFVPPKLHTKYGVPPKQHFISKPPAVYGPPPSAPHSSYGPPKQQFSIPKPIYGPPIKPAVNFKPQQSYGSPPAPIRQPIPAYGPPSLPIIQKPIHGAGCDGWKPIPGPSIGTQAIANSNIASIQSVVPDNSYLPPSSNSFPIDDAHLQVQPLPTNLQLPVAEAPKFDNDYLGAGLGASLSSGFGLTSINVVKSEEIELQSNHLDSYSAPPADAFAPDYHRKPPIGLTPPNSFPYSGPTFKQYPVHVSAPRHPIAFRPPVPQGLFDSIGQSVQHQDTFGLKYRQQSPVYLPPPTNEIPPPPPGLETLPLAPAAPFHPQQQQQQQQPKANLFNQFVYSSSQPCSHGPNLGGGSGNVPQFQSLPQLQTVYGVPNQPLDVSQSSSFEIAQNAGQQGLLTTSYGPPASGAVSGNFETLINTHEVHAPSSSYGPPPSGNPNDNFAHGSQKSLTTVQVDSANNTVASETDSKVDELPGLDSVGLNIISAQKSLNVEIPVQGQHGSYSLQFQSADPLASQNNEIDTPDHQKLLSEGLLQSILSAIEQPKGNGAPELSQAKESLENHPEVNEFVNSAVGQETLSEVKAE